jgi:hypothetical protein
MVCAECPRLGCRIRRGSLVIVHEHLLNQNLTSAFPFVRAAGHAFQKTGHFSAEGEDHQVTLSSTAIVKYVGIEKRNGLVSVGRQLLEGDRTLSPAILSFMSAIRCPA